MRVVITAATERELELLRQAANAVGNTSLQVSFHVSGVGMLATSFSLTKLCYEHKPELVIQCGIAGSLDETLPLGAVVVVKEEFIGDMGVEENGIFRDIFDIKLASEDEKPFQHRRLPNPWLQKLNLLHIDEVTGVTINEITTAQQRVKQLKEKYSAAIESMEGAALHYCCLQTSTPFIQFRSISNYVGERDKTKWKIAEALKILADAMAAFLSKLSSTTMKTI